MDARLYLGTPYRDLGRGDELGDQAPGLDCWGLVVAFYKREFGLELPSYVGSYASAAESLEVANVVAGGLGDWVRVANPKPGDVVLLWVREPTAPSHVGIVLEGSRVLNVRAPLARADGSQAPGPGACVESLRTGFWSRRVAGYFRHRSHYATWRLHIMPLPWSMASKTLEIPVGRTLAEGLAEGELVRAEGGALRVLIGDRAVDPVAEWNGVTVDVLAHLRPRAGDLVVARSLPGELVTITSFLVSLGTTLASVVPGGAALATAAGGLAVSAAAGTVTVGTLFVIEGVATFLTGALIAGATFAATTALTGLMSPSEPSQPAAIGPTRSQAATGTGNELRPFEVMPFGLGHFRAAPPFAAPPFTELISGTRYWRLLLLVGSGRYRLRDPVTGRPRIYVGEVPIDEMSGVEYEIHEGGQAAAADATADRYRAEILEPGANETRPLYYWPLGEAAGSSSAASITGTLALTRVGDATFGETSVVEPKSGVHSRTGARLQGSGRLEGSLSLPNGIAAEVWVEPEALGTTDRRTILCLGRRGSASPASGARLYHEGRDLIIEATIGERPRTGVSSVRISSVEKRYPNALPAEGGRSLIVFEAIVKRKDDRIHAKYTYVDLVVSVDGYALAPLGINGLGAVGGVVVETNLRPVPGAGFAGRGSGSGAPVGSVWSPSAGQFVGSTGLGGSTWNNYTDYLPPHWVPPVGTVAVGQEIDAAGAWSRGFRGKVQHVALYTAALPREEELWHFDVGSGSAVLDGATPGRGTRYRIFGQTVYERQINTILNPATKDEPAGTMSDWVVCPPLGARAAGELSIVVECPTGIWRSSEAGGARTSSVCLDVEYRRTSDIAWRKAPDSHSFGTTRWGIETENRPEAGGTCILIQGEIREAFTFEAHWFAEPGDYLLRARRVDREGPNNRGGKDTSAFGSTVTVLAFRAVEQGSPPLTLDRLTTIAISLPLGETGGNVDRIFVEGDRLLRTYAPSDPAANAAGWTPAVVTRNAADGALAILTDPDCTPEPLEAEDCDFDAFDALRATAGNFDIYVDFQSNVRDLANLVLEPSFATLSDAGDGRVSVIQDRKGLEPVGLISPRNARNFRVVKRFPELPHAVRVQFDDAADGFNVAQEIVYDDGFGEKADPANGIAAASSFDSVRSRGLNEREAVRAFYRKRTAANRVRTVEYACEVELDTLAWRRGEVVEFAHPTSLIGEKWGRVLTVTKNSGGRVISFTLDELLRYQASTAYGMRAQLADGRMIGASLANPGAGDSRVFTLTAPLPLPVGVEAELAEGDHVAVGRAGSETLLAMIRSIRPRSEDFAADVVLFPYAPQIHDAAEGPVDFVPPITRPVSRAELEAPAVPKIVGIRSDERWLLRTPAGLVTRARVVVSAPPSGRGASAAARARATRVGGSAIPPIYGAWSDVGMRTSFVEGLADGSTYDFEAQTQTQLGVASAWSAPVRHRVIGKSNPPLDVPDLRLEGDVIRWRYPSDQVLDLVGFEVRFALGSKPREAWNAATRAHDGLILGTEFPVARLPRAWGVTVYVLAVDLIGLRSDRAAVLLLEQGAPPRNVFRRIDERAAAWPGTITGGTAAGTAALVSDLVGGTVTGTATLDGTRRLATVSGIDLHDVALGSAFYFTANGVTAASRVVALNIAGGVATLAEAYEGASSSGACTIDPAAWRVVAVDNAGAPGLAEDDTAPAWDTDDTIAAWDLVSGELAYQTRRFVPDATTETGQRLTLEVAAYPPTAWLDVEYRELGPWPAWGPDDAADAWGPDDAAPAWASTTSDAGDLDGWSTWRPWPGQLDPLLRSQYDFRARVREDRKGLSALTQFTVVVDVLDRTEHVNDLVVGPEGARVPLAVAFHDIQRVRVTVQVAPGFDATGYGVADKAIDGPLLMPLPPGSRGLFDVTLEGF